jgi:hypothetical protein
MVGFILLPRSYYYLRRRSPGPPFPPDHRQAGERGPISITERVCLGLRWSTDKWLPTARQPQHGTVYRGRAAADGLP